MSTPLRTLAYVSKAIQPMDELALKELFVRAQTFNDKVDVTGMLVYADGWFVQTIEGIGDSLNQVFERIEQDSRHSIVDVFMRDAIERRVYPAWAMASSAAGPPTKIIKTFLYTRRDQLRLSFTAKQNEALDKTLAAVEDGERATWLTGYVEVADSIVRAT